MASKYKPSILIEMWIGVIAGLPAGCVTTIALLALTGGLPPGPGNHIFESPLIWPVLIFLVLVGIGIIALANHVLHRKDDSTLSREHSLAQRLGRMALIGAIVGCGMGVLWMGIALMGAKIFFLWLAGYADQLP